jgi:hypothetical protein
MLSHGTRGEEGKPKQITWDNVMSCERDLLMGPENLLFVMTMCVSLYVGGGLARQNSRAAGAIRLLSHPGEAYSVTYPLDEAG